MTNEEKAKSLWYHFCTEKSCNGHDDCKLCPKSQVQPQLLEMAAWKEQQMIDWLEKHVGTYQRFDVTENKFYYSYNLMIEDFKKAMEN